MSAPRRKLVLQLTPLLDLLLIVIFAQYMEMQQFSSQQQATTTQALAAAAQAQERVQLATASATEAAALMQQQNLEHAATLQLMSELLDLPQDVIDSGTRGKAPAELERIRQGLNEMTGGAAADRIHRLVSVAELRRASEIWAVHLDDDNVVRATAGIHHISFRAETPAEFQRQLWDWYHTLPPTKSLVLIQVTWGDAAFGPIVAAKQGVVTAAERMRQDRNSRSIFEYVILGFRPMK